MEFDLIKQIRSRATARDDVLLGIGDDAALLRPPPNRELVVATDALNAGIHFPHDTAPADIGWKALAVNLSDLAAMGAEPAWCTLSLCLPEPDAGWLDGFLDGFLELADRHRVALVGGDTTRGPLSIGVTVIGFVAPGRALRRDGARIGDEVWVSGSLGDAAAALALLQPPPLAPPCEAGPLLPGDTDNAAGLAALRPRLDRPTPRVELGLRLAGLASSAIDVSDGLLADLGHICHASGVGAEVQLDALPCSPALDEAFGPERRRVLQATGGDDYELCFSAPPVAAARIVELAAASGMEVTRIGRIIEGAGVHALDVDGGRWQATRAGHQHFRG